MRKWDEFGEQVNRLVYALAGRKYQADIEQANRAIADAIFYSEASVRMMRQGRFHPRELNALETLVEIGKCDAELGRDWAACLLRSGEHPAVDQVLVRVYPPDDQAAMIVVEKLHSPLLPRLIGAFLGALVTLLLWTYVLQPIYPAPHELPWMHELLWGCLLGLGLAMGLFAADRLVNDKRRSVNTLSWYRYGWLVAGGAAGAVVWKLTALMFAPISPMEGLTSTWQETGWFGAVYGLAFSMALVFARGDDCKKNLPRRWLLPVLGTLGCAGLCLAGYFMVVQQPSFATQKDVDMAVGILLRAGLIILSAYAYPE